MPEELAGERTEPATPRKRREAREKGQTARSQDLSTAMLLLVAFSTIYLIGEGLLTDFGGLLRRCWHRTLWR